MNSIRKTGAFIIPTVIIGTWLACSCSKTEQEENGNLVFQSLTIEKDTIAPGETAKVTAEATGTNLQYYWSASLGDILGSGEEVVYAASPCSAGKNIISCRVVSGSLEETKTVDIMVYE
ncbi:MAG: hypothetical protein ACOC0R_04490 [Mariniphaga sp.]